MESGWFKQGDVIVGPKGDKGDQGDPGIQGPPGEPGPADWDALPVIKGEFTPYPRGTGWTYISSGWWSRQANHVIVTGYVQVTAVGSHSIFQISGLPFNVDRPTFCGSRFVNLVNMPTQYSQTGYVEDSVFNPQYTHGSNLTYASYLISQIQDNTQCWFSASYFI